MRQILSGFLATAMIVSVASSVSFAASATAYAGIDIADATMEAVGTNNWSTGDAVTGGWKVTVEITGLDLALTGTNGKISIPLNITKEFPGTVQTGSTGSALTYDDITVTGASIANLLNGQEFVTMIDGAEYSGKLVAPGDSGDELKVQFNERVKIPGLTAIVPTLKATATASTTATIAGTADTLTSSVTTMNAVTAGSAFSSGSGDQTSDVEKTGDFFKNLDITKVVRCYGTGDPIPMTEKGVGVDKDLNDQGGVQSGKTLYFMINDETETTFNDDTYWKLKITKGDNAKLIKKITDTTKIFSNALVDANTGASIPGIDFTKRHRYIKVEMNEIFTDDEYKCTLDLRLTPTSKAESKFANQGVDGSEIKIKDFYFWVKNIVKTADNDWKVGVGGLMLNPLENDWNEVTYYDEDGDLAFMKFFADSDVSKFYAKLSTKWEHADYASYFNDQDAYIFDFVGSPKISATSRCDLEIYNPFVNEDGDETIDPATAVIYQVIDGDLFDVTDSFTYKEGDNGDMAYTTRTRFLGTYIICEKAVEEAMDNNDTPEELTPDTDTTPSEVTPDNNGGGKAPANTGKYL